MRSSRAHRVVSLRGFVLACAVLLAYACAVHTTAGPKPAGQQGFDSPESAVAALTTAMRGGDQAGLANILGDERLTPGAQGSGDSQAFLTAFDENHAIEHVNPATALLIIGKDRWTFPVPIVKSGKTWWFDGEAGLKETANRVMDRNELLTIETMRAYVAAQMEYAGGQRGETPGQFACRFASEEGMKDGLYWHVPDGETPSPLGPQVAGAAYSECQAMGVTPVPFHGYFYKILTKQGPSARGGAYDYMAGKALALGFACVAYPEKYGETGVMTFIVNQSGIVYQKDLGQGTQLAGEAMTAYDPDESWSAAESAAPAQAGEAN